MNTALVLAAMLVGMAVANFIPVVSRTEVIDDSGQFTLSYQSADGTIVSEQGILKRNKDNTDDVLVKRGSFTFQSPEGVPYTINYIADENGFRPEGAHLPVNVQPIQPVF